MAFKPQIEVYTNSNCNFTVHDVSISPDPAFDHVVLFWTDDNWATQSGDLSAPTSLEWTVPAVNGVIYNFYAFYCREWLDSTGTVVAPTNIIYDNGAFYENTSGVPITMNPGVLAPHNDPVNWTLMSSSNYTQFQAAVSAGYVLSSQDASAEVTCPMFTVRQTDECYIWTVCDVSGLSGDKIVNVYEYGSTTVLSTYTIVAGGCVDVTLPQDGVYVIECIYRVSIDISEYHLAYETCSIKTCFATLVNSILCDEYDPCCETGCTEAEKKTLQIKRDTLNQMTALFFMLMASIFVEHTNYMNILTSYQGTADETRDEYIQRVKDIIAKLRVIVGRCGQCQEQLPVTTGCQTCS